jgi:hypothetical protein
MSKDLYALMVLLVLQILLIIMDATLVSSVT